MRLFQNIKKERRYLHWSTEIRDGRDGRINKKADDFCG